MAQLRISDIELYYDLIGEGDDTIVLVHGGSGPTLAAGSSSFPPSRSSTGFSR